MNHRISFAQQKARTQYLERYAEKEAVDLAEDFLKQDLTASQTWTSGVLIPAHEETKTDLISTLSSLSLAAEHHSIRALCAVSMNCPLGHPARITRQTWNDWGLKANAPWELVSFSSSLDIVFINHFDFCQPRLEEAVGRERKWLSDFLLSLYAREALLSPRLYSTDSDAKLPHNYFAVAETSSLPVLTFPFLHEPRSAEIVRYEEYLNSYVHGLALAQSPYAYHALGSCLAFTVDAYAQVRGFPKKAAGEDFYFLNKARKLCLRETERIELKMDPIRLQSRLSFRTPFGTGAALHSIRREPDAYSPYSHHTFQALKTLRDLLRQEAPYLSKPSLMAGMSSILAPYSNSRLASLLEELGFFSSQDQWRSQSFTPLTIDLWLDAFRTMRIVNLLDGRREASRKVSEATLHQGGLRPHPI